MISFNQWLTEENDTCDYCYKKGDTEQVVNHDGLLSKICTQCRQNDDDLRRCVKCERLHNPSHDSEHCPECTKKDNRHEVRYYDHPSGWIKKHEYFNNATKAHNFAKNNSYIFGNSSVYHKGEHQKSYWQGK